MQKDVLLIGPYAGYEFQRTSKFTDFPLGIERLAAYLRKRGYNVDTFDPNLHQGSERILTDIINGGYRIIGQSVLHHTLENDAALMWLARRISPESLLVAGGEEATFNYRQILDISPVDVVVRGEGERPLLGIVQQYMSRGSMAEDLQKVTGLYVRDENHNIGFRSTGPNPALTADEFVEATMGIDVTKIPYPEYWQQLELSMGVQRRTIRIFTSNYCPGQCDFCTSTNALREAQGGVAAKVVFVPAQGLLELVYKVLNAYPTVQRILIHDDNYLMRGKLQGRAIAFALLAADEKRKGNLPANLEFICQTRIDDINEQVLRRHKDAGFTMISFGVESFSDKILADFGKRLESDLTKRVLQDTLNIGIQLYVNTILTSPNARIEDVLITIHECIEYADRGAQIAVYPYVVPFPGAKMTTDPRYKHLVMTKEVTVPGTDRKFQKALKILPEDKDLQKVMAESEDLLPDIRTQLKERFNLDFTPSSVSSLILFYSILTALKNSGHVTSIDREISTIEGILRRGVNY